MYKVNKFDIGDYVIPINKPLDSGGRPNIKKIEDIGFMCGVMAIYHLEGETITFSEDDLIRALKE